jgi:hypothetical protein
MYLNSDERIVIETWEEKFDLSRGGFRSVKRQNQQWPMQNTLRVTVYSIAPEELLGQMGKELNLRTRRPKRKVSYREVEMFLERLKERPEIFTRGSVNAQLDAWGRAAISPLSKLESMGNLCSGYASYAMRYLLENFPSRRGSLAYKNGVVHKGADFLRYGVKPLDEFGNIGFNGWPRRPLFLNHISVFVSSGIELVGDWHKEEFLERSMSGLEHGGLVLTKNLWPGVKMPKWRRDVSEVERASDVDELRDIDVQQSVHLKPLNPKKEMRDDFTLIARATQILLDRKPFTEKKSFGPTWWRLRADPFGKRAAQNLIPQLFSRLRFAGGALRLFNADRWIGIERDIIMMLATANLESSPNAVWGVAVDGYTEELVQEMHGEIESVLGNFGRPMQGPLSTVLL